jgi:hypothetical protein
MKTKTIVIVIAIAAIIYWLAKKAKATTSGKQNFKLKADWSANRFKLQHPAWGTKELNHPQGQEGAYNQLFENADLQLGWNRVPGDKIVVTLLHKRGNVFSEVYVLDLNAKTAQYYSELQPVTVTA